MCKTRPELHGWFWLAEAVVIVNYIHPTALCRRLFPQGLISVSHCHSACCAVYVGGHVGKWGRQCRGWKASRQKKSLGLKWRHHRMSQIRSSAVWSSTFYLTFNQSGGCLITNHKPRAAYKHGQTWLSWPRFIIEIPLQTPPARPPSTVQPFPQRLVHRYYSAATSHLIHSLFIHCRTFTHVLFKWETARYNCSYCSNVTQNNHKNLTCSFRCSFYNPSPF